MTYAERQEIFSKEYITTQELSELLGIGTQRRARSCKQSSAKRVTDSG